MPSPSIPRITVARGKHVFVFTLSYSDMFEVASHSVVFDTLNVYLSV